MAIDKGKVISVTSVKGGVGKTTILLNLAGIYYMMKKKVLIIDFDLYSGGVAALLNVKNNKDIFQLMDSISNGRFSCLSDYVTSYNKGIDVIASPRDPRQAMKTQNKYIPLILDMAKEEYDVVLVDTTHIIDERNLLILDNSYMSLFVITNDLIDLKNMKSLMSIFKDASKTNYLVCLNQARDTGRDYLSLFDIRNIIKTNIDYTISRNFYIKNIDKYVLDGEILTMNKNILRFHGTDIHHMECMAKDLISEIHREDVTNNG